MRFRILSFSVGLVFVAAVAHAQGVLANYAENSGSLPPVYAWHYSVQFAADGTVTTQYCKGYADDGPSCAQRVDQLSSAKLAQFKAAITPLARDFAARPVAELMEPPVGGGSITAVITDPATGTDLTLPPFPTEGDAPRTAAAIEVLRSFTPKGAIEDTMARALPPQ